MRYFLVDKVTELVVDKKIRGVKCVTLSDDILHDHFPDYPIMPGALILESLSQLAGFLLEASFHESGRRPLRAVLAQVQQAKFHASSGPGDQIELEVTLDSKLDGAARVSAMASVNGERKVNARLDFVLKDIASDRLHEQRRYIYQLWTKDLKSPPLIP